MQCCHRVQQAAGLSVAPGCQRNGEVVRSLHCREESLAQGMTTMKFILGIGAALLVTLGMGWVTLRATQTARVSEDGRELFKTYCAICHGSTGHGDGPLAASLRQPPADLTQFTVRNGGTFPAVKLHRIIDGRDIVAHGDPAMPVWGNAFRTSPEHTDEDAVRARTDAIVKFLKTIQTRRGK